MQHKYCDICPEVEKIVGKQIKTSQIFKLPAIQVG